MPQLSLSQGQTTERPTERGRSEPAINALSSFASSSPLRSQFPVWGRLNDSKPDSKATQRLVFGGERDYMHSRPHSTVKGKLLLAWLTKG